MKNRYIVGALWFSTKTDIASHARSILQGYCVGEGINQSDMCFVLGLLEFHPKKQTKIGCGVSEIRIMAPFSNCRCFQIVRTDGTMTDFSYKKCLGNQYDEQEIKKAARLEIAYQIRRFKEENFNGTCLITGTEITPDQVHVDHKPPQTFDVLFADFLRQENTHIRNIKTYAIGDCSPGRRFVDTEFAQRWKKYHQENAELRILSIYANTHLVPIIKGNYEFEKHPKQPEVPESVDQLATDPPGEGSGEEDACPDEWLAGQEQ